MADINEIITSIIDYASENLLGFLIIFLLGFLVDHLIICIIYASKSITNKERITRFLRMFFFMPAR